MTEAVKVLSISTFKDDHVFFREAFRWLNWKLVAAYSCVEALELVRSRPVGLVVSERDLPDGTWKDILDALAPLPCRPLLIVTSLHADNYLWAEVLNLGGYDVLAKPFDEREVSRVVTMAWERAKRCCERPPWSLEPATTAPASTRAA